MSGTLIVLRPLQQAARLLAARVRALKPQARGTEYVATRAALTRVRALLAAERRTPKPRSDQTLDGL